MTKAASKQAYYVARFLVDRPRVEDAYSAYAYFRWVDDVLDAENASGPVPCDAERLERTCFLERQQWLLARCLRGEAPQDTNPYEAMLVELAGQGGPSAGGLRSYLRHMMLVMEFDVRRRGLVVSQAELDEYTRLLATAVTDAMNHFIGDRPTTARDETRYLAASGAHILHMLRDTYDDLRAGYFNVPREVLEAHSIQPQDVDSDPYRAWVKGRVQLARTYFDAGREYLAHVESLRRRLAGLAYMARFEWLIETLERDDFRLRPRYDDGKDLGRSLRTSAVVLSRMIGRQGSGSSSPASASSRPSRS